MAVASCELENYIPLVENIVRNIQRHLPNHMRDDCLKSAGLLGLVQASKRFDPSLGIAFEAYARPRIRGAVQDALRTLDPLTRTQRKQVRTAKTAEEPLEAQSNDLASVDPIEVPLEEHESFIETPWQSPIDLEEVVDRRERLTQLYDRIDRLPERDRQTVMLYLDQERTLDEIGVELGVSASRVCQILTRVKKTLRQQLAV